MRISDTYLRQVDVYPSESKGEDVALDLMAPSHAYNAWWKLRGDAGERWDPVVRLTPLAMALLRKATGEDLLFAADQGEVPLFLLEGGLDEDVLLEECFDALNAIDKLGDEIHPIRRARILMRYLYPNKESTQ